MYRIVTNLLKLYFLELVQLVHSAQFQTGMIAVYATCLKLMPIVFRVLHKRKIFGFENLIFRCMHVLYLFSIAPITGKKKWLLLTIKFCRKFYFSIAKIHCRQIFQRKPVIGNTVVANQDK